MSFLRIFFNFFRINLHNPFLGLDIWIKEENSGNAIKPHVYHALLMFRMDKMA